MVGATRYCIAVLSAVVIAVSVAAPQAEKRSEQAQPIDDPTNPAPAPSASHASNPKLVSYEVKADGSISSKNQASAPPTGGRTQVQRDEDGHWRVVHYDVSNHATEDTEGNYQHQDEQTEDRNSHRALHVEQDDQYDDWVTDTSPLPILEASEAFVALEDRIADEGHTPELVDELVKIAGSRTAAENSETADDWAFAVAKLAFRQLFEPNVESAEEQPFIDAIHNLHIAADAGVQSALGVLAMLDLVGVLDPEELANPNVTPLSLQDKQARADQTLLSLYDTHDFMATLAVAYGTLSGRIPVPLTDSTESPVTPEAICEAALPLFHTCAEENVHIVVDEGGERPVEVVRLSDELLDPNGGFFDEYGFGGADPLRDENEARHELEYYRGVANNPMDEQYPQAMQRLGEIYFFGNPAAHVPADHGLAAQFFRQAADAGDPLAQANYGMLLANGMGVAQDAPQALVYFNRAARQNEAFAVHGLGVLYFTGNGVRQNVTRALEYFREAVALGYAESHSFLGSAYLHGDGVAIDHKLAFEHCQAAVDGTGGQSSQAVFNLGIMHFEGIGTPRSCLTALPLFRTVALHPDLLSGLPFSLVKAYECYQKGDYLRAYLHYRLVAELGDEDAQCNAAFLLEHHGSAILKWNWLGLAKSTEDSRQSPLREAFALYSQAAALNDSEAVRKTGACFHEPWAGVCPSNRTRALERYQLAAELGDAQAGYNCGLMLLTGDGVPQDLTAARSYYADCSQAAFPANVPCSLALMGLDLFLVLKAAAKQLWVA